MQDAFMDYLDDLDLDLPESDPNNVVLCQGILWVLQRRAVHPELTRFALETLAKINLAQDDCAKCDGFGSAIKLAKVMTEVPLRSQKGKKAKADVKYAKDSMTSLTALLKKHVSGGRASERMEAIRRNIGFLCQMFQLGTAEARLLFAAYACQNHPAYDRFADGILTRSKSLASALSCLLGIGETEATQLYRTNSPLAQTGLVSFDVTMRVFTAAVSRFG